MLNGNRRRAVTESSGSRKKWVLCSSFPRRGPSAIVQRGTRATPHLADQFKDRPTGILELIFLPVAADFDAVVRLCRQASVVSRERL
jgi:hypothetical protein